MNKFQTMIIAFYSLVASHLPRPSGRLVGKISATITFLFRVFRFNDFDLGFGYFFIGSW